MNDEEFIKVSTNNYGENNGISNKTSKSMKIAIAIACGIIVVISSYLGFSYASTMCRVPNSMISDTKPEVVVNISLDNGVIKIVPEKVATKLRTSTIEFGVNNSNNQIYSIDIFDDYFYETLFNEDLTKQYASFIGNKKQELGNFDIETVSNVIDSTNSEFEHIESKSESNDGIAGVETINSLYKEGYKYNCGYYLDSEEVDKADFSDYKNSITSNDKYTKDIESNISKKINFDGFGTVDLNDLDVFTGKFGIMYSANNGLISIFDEDKDSTVLFITNMNNNNLQNIPLKLIPVEKYKNVYVDYGWQNKSDFGYGSFAIMTNSGMYYFKIGESVENPEEFAQKVINWLGVNTDDEYIDTGYDFVLTLDNLRDTLEDEEAKQENNELSANIVGGAKG